MPSLGDYLNKPEYLFRPSQVARRLARALRAKRASAVVTLPWRLPLRIRIADDIGRALWTTGVYDLAVSEALWRLIEPGDTVVDAGANIGYMTSLMVARAGAAGTVWAFEPHPALFAELAANRERWRAPGHAAVELRELALSDRPRDTVLVEGAAFAANRGTARVADGDAPGIGIHLSTLDAELPVAARLGVLKVDVEGHEAAVLRGATQLLAKRAIRDIVYEEHQPDSDSTALLRSRGYQIFDIRKRLFGPALEVPGRGRAPAWMPPSRLASADPERARARLARRGWRCLGGC